MNEETNEDFAMPTFEALVASALKTLYQISQNKSDTENFELLPVIMMAIIAHPESEKHQLLTHVCGQLYVDCTSLFPTHIETPHEFH